MARQAGPFFITGTIDEVVFYKMGDKYYLRQKGEPTSTTKKRMSQEQYYPALYMRKQEFKQASQWVRTWYYTLPQAIRRHGLFGTLTGKAVRLLRKGVKEETIKTLLLQELGQAGNPLEQPVATTATTTTQQVKAAPSPTAPTQRRKKKQATAAKFSCWRVGKQGQLEKAVARGKATVTNEKSSAGLFVGYYSTWTVSG